MSSILLYTLAGVSLLAAIIVTILNGLTYAALQSAPHAPAAGLAPVALGVLTCAALIGLNLILHKDVRNGQQWPRWKQGVFYFTGAYLLIAAASITGTMAKDELRSTANNQGLFIARSVFWSFSVFTQGLYYGYLVVALVQRNSTTAWPHPYSQDLKLESLPDSPSTLTPPSRIGEPEEFKFDTRRSSLRKYPRRSHRFSGGTLCLQNTLTPTTTNTTTNTTTTTNNTNTNTNTKPKAPRPNSFETTSSVSTILPQTPTEPTFHPNSQNDTRPLLRNSIRSMPSLRRDHIPASLDSLIRPPPLSPSSPSISSRLSPDSPTTPTAVESNIHPLFRSNSSSPSPSPGPGTSVKASPSAGQTITKQTLTRMRSARSLRERERVPSPLPSPSLSVSLSAEEEREERVMAFMRGGKGRYELNESPYEK